MKTNQPTVRLIEPKDNLAVAKVIRQVMTDFDCVGEGYSIEDPEVDQMYETYQGENARFWVVEQGGQVKGGGGFAPLKGGNPSVCELQKMYFLQDVRGYRLGRKILDLSLEAAQKIGFKTMYLETTARMDAANNLYRKNGFIKLENPEGCTGHGGCDTFYTKELI